VSRILVLYGSTYGQTLRVAGRIAEVLTREGHSADLIWGDRTPKGLDLAEYDGVIIAASVLMGRYQRYVRDFARRNAERLNAMPKPSSRCAARPAATRHERGHTSTVGPASLASAACRANEVSEGRRAK
jgi:menaquinone-dependent protoporphyrinogen IX oxidase